MKTEIKTNKTKPKRAATPVLKPYKWKRGEGKVGTLAFFCHHGVPVEVLTEPAGIRTGYINDNKPGNQRPLRLAAFMPVPLGWQPKYLRDALAKGDKLRAEGDKLLAEGRKLRAEAITRATPALLKRYKKEHPEIDTALLASYNEIY